MHATLLGAFFTAAIVGATGAFVRLDPSNVDFWKWTAIYVLFVLYRTKIMIDDLGWYAYLKSKTIAPNPIDVLFAIATWLAWFMMAAVMGDNIEYFMGFFVFAFAASTVWIYVANSLAPEPTGEHKRRYGFRLLRLKDERHVRWLLCNLVLIAIAIFCYFAGSANGPAMANRIAIWISASPEAVYNYQFAVVFGISYLVLLLDVVMNIDELRKALADAYKI